MFLWSHDPWMHPSIMVPWRAPYFIFTSAGMLFPPGIQLGLCQCVNDTWQGLSGNSWFAIRIESPLPYILSSSGTSIDTRSYKRTLQLSGCLGSMLSLVIKFHTLARNTDVGRTGIQSKMIGAIHWEKLSHNTNCQYLSAVSLVRVTFQIVFHID